MNIMSPNYLFHKTHSTKRTSQADRSRAFCHYIYIMHSVRASQMTSSVSLKMQFHSFNIFYWVTIYHALFSLQEEFCWTGNSLKFFPFIFFKFFILKYRWHKTYHFNQFQLYQFSEIKYISYSRAPLPTSISRTLSCAQMKLYNH